MDANESPNENVTQEISDEVFEDMKIMLVLGSTYNDICDHYNRKYAYPVIQGKLGSCGLGSVIGIKSGITQKFKKLNKHTTKESREKILNDLKDDIEKLYKIIKELTKKDKKT